jgi:hypothetical protein
MKTRVMIGHIQSVTYGYAMRGIIHNLCLCTRFDEGEIGFEQRFQGNENNVHKGETSRSRLPT